MSHEEWMARTVALQNCQQWHSIGHHERVKCPLDEATCDFVLITLAANNFLRRQLVELGAGK